MFGNIIAGQIIIAPAAADRSDPDGISGFVPGLFQQLRLIDGPSIIFEPAHNGGIKLDVGFRRRQRREGQRYLFKFGKPGVRFLAGAHRLAERFKRLAARRAPGFGKGEHTLHRCRIQSRALGKVAAFVHTPSAQ